MYACNSSRDDVRPLSNPSPAATANGRETVHTAPQANPAQSALLASLGQRTLYVGWHPYPSHKVCDARSVAVNFGATITDERNATNALHHCGLVAELASRTT